jgi:hypothetical protein
MFLSCKYVTYLSTTTSAAPPVVKSPCAFSVQLKIDSSGRPSRGKRRSDHEQLCPRAPAPLRSRGRNAVGQRLRAGAKEDEVRVEGFPEGATARSPEHAGRFRGSHRITPPFLVEPAGRGLVSFLCALAVNLSAAVWDMREVLVIWPDQRAQFDTDLLARLGETLNGLAMPTMSRGRDRVAILPGIARSVLWTRPG